MRRLILVLALCVALPNWVRAQEPQRRLAATSLENLDHARLMGFDLSIRGGRVATLDQIPAGWSITVDNDPSWRTGIRGHAIVGAAALSVEQLPSLFSVVAPPPSVAAELRSPTTIAGTVTLMSRGQLRTTRLPHAELSPAP